MEEVFYWFWGISGVIMLIASIFYAGYAKVPDIMEHMFPTLIWILIWPFALAALIVASPFIGVYYLGVYMKSRQT